MRRSIPIIIALAASLVAASLVAPGIAAQDDLLAGHPAVGTWVMDDGGVALIHADGTFSSTGADGGVVFGAWTPTGKREVAITFTFLAPAEAGVPGGHATARATARLSTGGTTIDVVATIEVPTPDGGTTGQLGPIESRGTRLIPEPPGEPVGPWPSAPPSEDDEITQEALTGTWRP
jgi:hypothetical protein